MSDDDIKNGRLLASTMTDEDLIRGLKKALEDSRQSAAQAVSRPVVITLEAMGYRIVPAWMVEMLEKVMAKGAKDG